MKALIALGAPGVMLAVMFYMWWQERTERRELNGKLITMTADGIAAEKDMTNALNLLASKIRVTP